MLTSLALGALAAAFIIPGTRRAFLADIDHDWLAGELELDHILPDGMTVKTKSGLFSRVIHIAGLNYDAKTSQVQEHLLKGRNTAFHALGDHGIGLRFFGIKRPHDISYQADWPSPALHEIGVCEQAQFQGSFAIKLARQLKKDVQCLLPDFRNLMPNIGFEDVNFSICDRSAHYMNALWLDPDTVADTFEKRAGTAKQIMTRQQFRDLSRAREKVRRNRQKNLVQTLAKGLAQADKALENSRENSAAIDGLEASTEEAEDAQTRMAVTSMTGIIQARIQN